MKENQIRELVNELRDIAIEYHGTQQLRERIARTVRAAIIQAGNSPSKCSLRDGIEAIRNSGIPVDVDKIQSECEAGNSPAIPDDWVMVPKEPTQAMINAWLSEVANWRGHVAGYKAALAAAPQQEMK
ncbi:hypothetical protein CAD93_19000 [Salmonella enterica subsp. enterica serovar Tennessee]|nr:hypothetical protein [Salmonella enterica subsp. enterica serovar Tennessee]